MKHAMKWLLGLLVMLPVQPVFAHTGIETTFPADGETVTEAVDAVSLTFETPIEAGSRFSVTDAAGEAVRVNGITVEGDRLSGTVAEPYVYS